MKALLAIRQEGVGQLAEQLMAFAEPPGIIHVCWELRVRAELISISPFIPPSPFYIVAVVTMAAVGVQPRGQLPFEDVADSDLLATDANR